MSKADCGIFPSRAEGWNLDMLEMMALNKSIITTNYSAHTEFCNKDNSFLIDISETEPANDGKWFFGQGNWAKIGEEQKRGITIQRKTRSLALSHRRCVRGKMPSRLLNAS